MFADVNLCKSNVYNWYMLHTITKPSHTERLRGVFKITDYYDNESPWLVLLGASRSSINFLIRSAIRGSSTI